MKTLAAWLALCGCAVAADDRIGFATHFDQGWPVSWMPLIAQDSRWIRDDIPWSSFDHGPAGYSLPASKTSWLNAAKASGLKVVAVMESGGVYGAPSNYPATPLTFFYTGPGSYQSGSTIVQGNYGSYNPQAYAAAAAWLATQYPGTIEYIEVLNEPNNRYAQDDGSNWLADLVTLTNAVTDAVHATGTGVKVIGLGGQGSQIVSMLGMNPRVDGVVVHPYDPNTETPEMAYEPPYATNAVTGGYEKWLSVIQPLLNGRELLETEFDGDGFWNWYSTADWLMRRIPITLYHGVTRSFIYTWSDEWQGITWEAYPQQAYYCFQRLFGPSPVDSRPMMENQKAWGANKITVTSGDPAFDFNNLYSYLFAHNGTDGGYTVAFVWQGNQYAYPPSPYGVQSLLGMQTHLGTVSFPRTVYFNPYKSYVLNTVTDKVYYLYDHPYSWGGGTFTIQIPISQEPMAIVLNYN